MATVVGGIVGYAEAMMGYFGAIFDRNHLYRFLRSSMEGPRQSDAAHLADSILAGIDFPEGAALRQLVAWREQSANVSYRQQRDHTAHTVHNFLLGKYIYENTAIGPEIDKYLDVEKSKRTGESFAGFESAWPYCSLLHDVGYLFEGSASPLSQTDDSPYVETGLITFQRFMDPSSLLTWFGLRSRDAREWGAGILRMNPPADGDPYQRAVAYLRVAPTAAGALDAFDMWRAWYSERKISMVPWIDTLQELFESHALVGHPKHLKRFLNHAVCSGMMLLKILGSFYALGRAQERHLPDLTKTRPPLAAEIKAAFAPSSGVTYSYDVWTNAILSGTVASALHDLMPDIARLNLTKLKISDDPLAFLGLLVDELQHWDRFVVHELFRPDSLQSLEIGLGLERNRVVVGVPDSHVAQITRVLSRSLENWQEIVDLRAWSP